MKKIYIVGAGICGISAAVQIAENFKNQNVEVIVVAEKFTPNTTSDLVAGLWGPYLMGSTPEHKIVQWSKTTHEYFHHLWLNGLAEEAGITMIPCYRLSAEEEIQNPCWKNIVFGFRELTSQEISKMSREHRRKYLSGSNFVTFCCEPIKFIPFMTKRFIKAGGKLETRKLRDFDELKDADLIVNCTGLGGKELGDEQLHPIRGQITRVSAPWMYFVMIDDSDDGNYIIPNAESVVLGGTHQYNDFNTKFSTSDNDFIMNGCQRMVKSLENAERLRDIVGLRPGRDQVRLEIVHGTNGKAPVIHNVGHGGCGVTLSWGCGQEVLEKTVEVMKGMSKLFHIATFAILQVNLVYSAVLTCNSTTPPCVVTSITPVTSPYELITIDGQPSNYIDETTTDLSFNAPNILNYVPTNVFNIFPKTQSNYFV
ncbi:hypothetical protein PVAND_013020 [Polypedilum vanderplanki]|uniref:FAD dependent oxidoreductase domain-containing protein n=1 Tax=Polypedilum vanderplanki TaxID=319348 RepID=A0A9J6CQ66_POLVA|nr:hypothetical protein PVAND_013020 [Polypedilum vanderplanki]